MTLRAHYGALIIGGVFLLLSLVYNVTIPAWEADNELSHFGYVRYLVKHQELPRTDSQVEPPVMTDACRSGEQNIRNESPHQFRQPPLYYVLGALTTFWIDAETVGPDAANPFRMWDPGQLGYNFALHNPSREGFPYTGALLALHLLRLLSGLLALGGLLATYLLGLLLFAGRRPLALAMMAVNAFIPQYIFASAIVNNDILVTALSGWCVLLCAYVVLHNSRISVLFLAAFVAALAITAKYSAIVLLPLVGLTALVVPVRVWRTNKEHFVRTVVKVALIIGVASVPVLVWIGRNKVLYNQFFASYGVISSYIDYFLVGAPAPGTPGAWHAARYAFTTFWAQFGWGTLTLPSVLIALLAAVCTLAAVGVVLYLLDKRQPGHMRLIVLVACFFFAETLLLSYVKAGESPEPPGRYLFPALSAICFLLVLGLHRILPQRLKLAGVMAVWVGLLALAVAVPLLVLKPAYAPPRVEASSELLPGEEPLYATIGGFAELLGYRVEPQHLTAGDPIRVTLVWRALQSTINNYTLSIHLLDGDKYPRAWVMSHPGHGNYPTSIWRPGDTFRETYQLYWTDTPWERLPSLASFKVALFCPGSPTVEESYLEAVDSQGATIGDAVYFGRIKVSKEQPIEDRPALLPPAYTFGNQLALESYRLVPEHPEPGQQATIEMRWRALQQVTTDYTVFAHLVDAQGQQVTGNDQPLTDGYYPSSLWEAGEIITHTHRLSLPLLPPGSVNEIRVGVYDPRSGQRLPLRDRNNNQVQGDQIHMAEIDVPY